MARIYKPCMFFHLYYLLFDICSFRLLRFFVVSPSVKNDPKDLFFKYQQINQLIPGTMIRDPYESQVKTTKQLQKYVLNLSLIKRDRKWR